MRIIKNSLLFLSLLALAQRVAAQAPNISYNNAPHTLLPGVTYSISPANSGGAVPAGTYGNISTFAGSPAEIAGYIDASDTAARFNWPQQAVKDASGNLFVTDAVNNVIRKITSAGVVSTFAGSTAGLSGFTDATGTAALFDYPDGITIDGSGNLFVSDYENNAIRKITAAGVVSTFYSTGSTFGPGGLCFDNSGNLIVAAQDASQVLSISSGGTASLVAGSTAGYANGTGAAAQFNIPSDVRVDASGNIYVVDFENNAIRKITSGGVVTTFAGSDVNGNTPGFADGKGTAAVFNNPTGLTIGPGGVIYVADLYNNNIRRIMPDGTVTLLAGSAAQVPGDSDGTGTAAGFNQPVYIYMDNNGMAYVSELGANRIRKLVLTGYTLKGTLPSGLSFNTSTGVISGAVSALTAPLTDTVTAWNASGFSTALVKFKVQAPIISYDVSADTIASGVPYTLSPSNIGGSIPALSYASTSTFAGSTSATSGYTNGSGTSARFNNPSASVSDANGNIYVADAANNAIRMIDPSGAVTTFAGSSSGSSGFTNANGTSALFSSPNGLAFDASGNLFVSDYGNNAIREIDPSGNVTTFYHSTGTFGPAGLTFDASGNIIVAAQDLHQIISITPGAVATTLAGSTSGYTNATGASAQFHTPTDVKMDANGNFFVADYANNAIRQIDPTGAVTTFAGSASGSSGSTDAVGTAALFNGPRSLAVAPGGVLYVADLANNGIRRILPDGTVALVAGSSSQTSGNSDGTGLSASFNQPNSIYLDDNATAYVTESAGNRVRKLPMTGYSLASILPSGLSLDPSTGTISGTVTGTVTPTTMNILAFNSSGFALALPPAGGSNINWTGAVNTDWTNRLNWSPTTRAPNTTDVALIGVAAYASGNQPGLITGTTTTIGQLQFGPNTGNPAPVLTLGTGVILNPTLGFLVNAGANATILGPGTLQPASSGSKIVSGGTLKIASNLVINLVAPASINNLNASMTSETFIIDSDASGSSSIGPITGLSTVGGPVSVRRWVTGNSLSTNRGYRQISSPVYQSTLTVGTNTFNIYSLNYVKNTSYLTGDVGGGFDNTGAANPTLYFFREDHASSNMCFTCGSWRGVAAINNTPQYNYAMDSETGTYNLATGSGFLFFYRGDRSAATFAAETTTTYLPTSAALSTTGLLNQGEVPYFYWYTNSPNLSYSPSVPGNNSIGDNFVGNPYPCTIDLMSYSSTNTTAGIYSNGIDPTHFEELMDKTGTYGTYDVTTNLPNGVGTSGASRYIPSGAGFFVVANTGTGVLKFHETAKVSSQAMPSGTGLFMAAGIVKEPKTQYLRLAMNADSGLYEDIVVIFDNDFKEAYEPGKEATYRLGYNKVSLSSLSSDHIKLAINKQPLPGNTRRVIGLNATATENGTYHFKLSETVNLPNLYDIWLIDHFTKDSVDLRSTGQYDFAINLADAGSFGDKRFSLLVKQNSAYAYKLIDFTASKLKSATREVQVNWKAQNEENYTHFTVERSTDGGKAFDVLGGETAAATGNYSFVDKSPVIGQNLYRLKQEDINNAITYSKIIGIQYTGLSDQLTGNRLSIYPNPASSTISLAIATETTAPAAYKISFTNSMGTVVKTFRSSQATWQGNVSGLLPGSYLVRVTDDKTQGFVAESKFVKL